MKITLADQRQGKVLILCVFMAAAVGLVLVSYLQLGNSHETLTARSQAWNTALPIAEAGLEEALTQLNYIRAKKGKILASNGWSTDRAGDTIRTRTLSSNAYFSVKITVSGKNAKDATITSTGYVLAPRSTNYISRTILSTASKTNTLFIKSMIARKHIRAGVGTLMDSFDSSSSTYSTGGLYDAAKRKAAASIATTSTKPNAIKVDNTKVYGDASTAPKGGVEFRNRGTVGDTTWVNGGNLGGQPSKITSTFTYDYQIISEPWAKGTGVAPLPGVYNKISYQYVLGTGDYELGATTLSKPMIVTSNAMATLYVTGDFLANQDIVIEKGATLKLYMGGSKFEVRARNVDINGGNATQFQYYGLPTNRDLRFGKKGDTALTGIIYAPKAKIKIEGGNDVVGSVVGKCIHLKHDGAFHYDEAINIIGSDYDTYVVKTWQE